ncbi:hypothetical protein AMTRI_Chr07g25390 [Amborella trichopoda]
MVGLHIFLLSHQLGEREVLLSCSHNGHGGGTSCDALSHGVAVVALESTIISHGMPYPQNLETAKQVE